VADEWGLVGSENAFKTLFPVFFFPSYYVFFMVSKTVISLRVTGSKEIKDNIETGIISSYLILAKQYNQDRTSTKYKYPSTEDFYLKYANRSRSYFKVWTTRRHLGETAAFFTCSLPKDNDYSLVVAPN